MIGVGPFSLPHSSFLSPCPLKLRSYQYSETYVLKSIPWAVIVLNMNNFH